MKPVTVALEMHPKTCSHMMEKNPEKHLTPGSSLITKVRLILWNDVGSENIYLLFNKCL